MTSGHRSRLKDLFAEALALPAADRQQFAARSCGADASLRAELESLLAGADAAGDFLEQPAQFGAGALRPFLPAPIEPLEPHRRLGPYEVLERVGAGGMGHVYRARDVRLDRIVALKVLPPAAALDEEARRRFDQEARAVAKLNHPSICALYDVGHHEGTDFLVMEYVEGETLGDALARGPLPPATLVGCAIDLTDALDRAHRLGVIHRDLKPSNVMLTESGAKLLDFGIAKLRDQEIERPGGESSGADPALTQSGRVIGTIAYMSPEQVRGDAIDERSDVFSFGAVLFEMAVGRQPFAAPNAEAVRERVLAGMPPSIDVRSGVPPRIADVIRKALATDREQRYQHARDARADLQRLHTSDRSSHRRRYGAAAAAAMLLAAAAIGAYVLASRHTNVAAGAAPQAVAASGDGGQHPARRGTGDDAAYEAYLKGRYFWNMRTTDGLQKALGYFDQAIARDPDYAQAYSGLADTYAMLGSMPYAVMPGSEAGGKAKAAASRALALDESLVEARVSLAFVTYAFEGNWAEGERDFKRAVELDPSYGTGHLWYALFLGQVGRIDESLAEAERCRALDPLSLIGTYSVGLAHYFGRRYDAAAEFAQKALEIDPRFPSGRRLLGQTYAAQGRADDALAEMLRLNANAPRNWLHMGLLANAYGRANKPDKAREILDGMIQESKTTFVPAAQVAIGYVGIGDRDAAFAWLDRAVAEHSQALNFLKTDPMFDAIRSDPRYAALITRVGFP